MFPLKELLELAHCELRTRQNLLRTNPNPNPNEFLNPNVKEAIEKFNRKLVERLNDSNHRVELPEGAEKILISRCSIAR